MQKSITMMVQLLAAGSMMLGSALAQTTPAATPTQPASGQSAAAAKKPTATTAAKKPTTAAPLTLKTQKEKSSYALGMKIGGDLRRQTLNESVDPALVARGLKDALSGGKTVMTEEDERAALTQLRTDVNAKMETKAHQEGAANRKEGEAFLAENKSKPGVVTLPDGLQYKVVTEGTGPKPTASDTVSCNYSGTLINGKEFDSSYKRGHPESFPVGGVIKGWTEALQLMPVGSKWQLFIPADLAYGDRPPQGGDIAAGDTLVFQVELLSIGEQTK
jgi:FKBP-type peptidyl-prolyl cis-trans isomerase FklB